MIVSVKTKSGWELVMPREFKTRDGVKLEISAVPSMVVLAMQKTLVKPEVPTWRNEEKQRTEENPNDPAYVLF